MGQFNTYNPIYCKKVIERTNPILETLSTWYTQHALIVFNALIVIMHHDDNGRE